MKRETGHTLTPRLSCIYELVRQDSEVYDIGSDHGYLPIALIANGVCPRAVVTDLNAAPLAGARSNFEAAGLSEKASFIQTDGARDIAFSRRLCDVAVCGMGGELISEIIRQAPQLKDPDFHLILQPMTRADRLRCYLWDNGFSIDGEAHAVEGDKSYVIFSARYTGKMEEYSETETLLGRRPDDSFRPMQKREYYQKVLATQEKILLGKETAGKASPSERAFLSEMKTEIEERIKYLK